jgi:capsid protein
VLPRSEWIARTGWDAEQIEGEIAADNRRADGLGLVLDTDPRKTTLQGMEQQGSGANQQ